MVKKKKFKAKIFIIFLVYEIVFTIITAPFYIFKGPFNNLKRIVVATIMGTRHTYIATTFLSVDQINNILNKQDTANDTEAVDVSNIKVNNNRSNEIVRYDLHPDSGRYDGYLLEIPVPTKVKVAVTNNLGVEGQKTSEMAKDHNAVAAINGGGFYDANKTAFGGDAAFPGGFVISNGQVIYPKDNSNADTKYSVTAFTKIGQLIVGNYSLNELRQKNVSEAICFRGPVLIANGKGQISDKNAASSGLQPVTAIGQKRDGTVLFLVMDGRKNLIKSGATMKDAQDELLKFGAYNATNLDGGYSSTMYYDGSVINNPHGLNGERYVATVLYVEP
ncbi:MAG: exopolysaccharide biosynthesis protein [Clostridiaceae bacterium]|nr:exopolysaccharide biosynthesis protein [Clostridiaceae bacterium]